MKYLSLDFETSLIRAGARFPKAICCTFQLGKQRPYGLGNHPEDGLEAELLNYLVDDDVTIVTHNGGFDYTVMCVTYPDLIPFVFEKLDKGLATDTLWREKLLNLSSHGKLDMVPIPGGGSMRLKYSLADFVLSYRGLDISEAKNDPNSWRLRFAELDGLRWSEYPSGASGYALNDAEYTLLVYHAQTERALNEGLSLATEHSQIAKSFMLSMQSNHGIMPDPEATEQMAAEVDRVTEETKSLLEQHGIIRSDENVGPPKKKHMDLALALLHEAGFAEQPEDWTPFAPWLAEFGVEFIKGGKPGSCNTKRLHEHTRKVWEYLGKEPVLTDTERISLESETLDFLAEHDPILEQYQQRQELGKLRSQIIPMLRSGEVVYPDYDALKETGRTSSYDGGKAREAGQERMYPSINIQQIPGEIKGLDPRQCFKPRPGTVFWDVDFTALELACVAHVTYTMFGESVHRDRYNAGVDLHAYLGAQLALGSDNDGQAMEFAQECRNKGLLSDPLATYELFKAFKKLDEEDPWRKFFKHYRNFAKPVGLGFPGGLGPATMVSFARKTYGVTLTEEKAREFRELWRETYPEMVRFFKWLNEEALDERNFDEYGDPMYTYTSPMGMVRAGATYCAAANGLSMQSPGAEAATRGAFLVTRACFDPSQESILLGCRPIAFVHDQQIGETTTDRELWAPQCLEVARLMRKGAEEVLTSIKMRTDEALLTERWSKAAVPTFDAQGKLIPWKPKAA